MAQAGVVICNKDCFNCPFPDCVNDDGLDWNGYKDARARDKLFRTPEEKKLAAKQRAYREANREEIAAKKRAYYEANREAYNAYMRDYMRKERRRKP